MKLNNKLALYSEVKNNFRKEPYLNIKEFEYRSAITRLRLSNHGFPIERGRYQKIPRNERICMLCDKGEIGDEQHIIMSCTSTKQFRDVLFKSMSHITQYKLLDTKQQFLYLLSCTDMSIIRIFGKMVLACIKKCRT